MSPTITAIAGGAVMKGGVATPITATVRWSPADPAAMEFEFELSNGELVEWTVSRELVSLALTNVRTMGEGDFRARLHGADSIQIDLESPEGVAEIRMRANEIQHVLTESIRECIPYSLDECNAIEADLDLAVARILEAA